MNKFEDVDVIASLEAIMKQNTAFYQNDFDLDRNIFTESGGKPHMNCTPFVRQYGILSNKWGVLLCQKEYQTNDIRRNSRSW